MENHTTNHPSKTNYAALSTLTTVFFFWGFIAAGNSVFIPFCKNYFHLDQFQSQLIDFAFYGAYYLGALGLFNFSTGAGKDLIGSWGYKKSIVYGLLFSALGAIAMIISVSLNVFSGMLFGLFIVALGFSLQQTAANPFMISLGDEKTGSNRINFGGAINSLGTSIGPILVSLALFGSASAISDDLIAGLSLNKVIFLYSGVGCLFLGIAALFGFSRKVPAGKVAVETDERVLDNLKEEQKTDSGKKTIVLLLVITGLLSASFAPVFSSYRSDEAKRITEIQSDIEQFKVDDNNQPILESSLSGTQLETKNALELQLISIQKPLDQKRMCWLSIGIISLVGGILFANRSSKKNSTGWGAMQYPQLSLGMLAIFVYVGVEVAIGSNLGALLEKKAFGGYSSSQITPFVSMFWGSLMIGRWAGSINVFDLKNSTKQVLRLIIPLIAFGIVLGFTALAGYSIQPLYWYILCVFVQIIAFYVAQDKPAFSLALFGFLGLTAVLIGMNTTGITAVYAFLSAGLFCSIMWPCIFSLSLAGLGKYQAQGSGFLVMMILGGALIPPLQGKLSDIIGIQQSFVVGAICFGYILFFALFVGRILKKQGLSLDEKG